MKKIIALLLSCALALTGCKADNGSNSSNQISTVAATETATYDISTSVVGASETQANQGIVTNSEANFGDIMPDYNNLNDPDLIRYVEDSVYDDLVTQLNSEGYFVENVQGIYISKEYLEELEYNSQSNIYFGYSLEELENQFQGTKYVFTLGENGTTTVKAFEEYDDTYEKVIKNVAIGAGVILVCVTVSVITGGIGTGAVSIIFATSAKTAATYAISSAVIGGAGAGIVKGIETQDFDEAMKAAALAGSEGFKWGAISGAIVGGVNGASTVSALKGADVTANGLKLKDAAKIQKESKFPLDVIKQIKSMDEYKVYKEAGLVAKMVNGKTALVPDIDWSFKSTLPNGDVVTNLERVVKGYAPIEPATGKAYQLHHIGQKAEGTLAVLTEKLHQGNASILNTAGKESEIDRAAFNKVRESFWKDVGKQLTQGVF